MQCNSTLGNYKFPSQFVNIFLTYQTFVTNLHLLIKSRIPLQVARKIAPCDRAFNVNSSFSHKFCELHRVCMVCALRARVIARVRCLRKGSSKFSQAEKHDKTFSNAATTMPAHLPWISLGTVLCCLRKNVTVCNKIRNYFCLKYM